MGQAMTSETLSIHGNDGFRYWVGLQAKPHKRGRRKMAYKGVLLGQGSRQWEKVIVKAFTELPGTRENWKTEEEKAVLAKDLAAVFPESCPSVLKIRVIIPGLVQMDKVSKINRWLEHRHGFKALDKDDWVSIEENVKGSMFRFCPWTHSPSWDELEVMESNHMTTFSHFTYKHTDGELVACEFQAAIEGDSYVITDLVIHSKNHAYGYFDKGEMGISEFFKWHRCTPVCKEWPKPQDLTPATSSGEDNVDGKKRVHFDLNLKRIFFSSGRIRHRSKSPLTLRRHASDEGAKMKKKWQEKYNKGGDQLCPASPPASDGPPPYDWPEPRGRHRAISDTSGAALVRPSDVDVPSVYPMRSCLKRTYSDHQITYSTTKDFTITKDYGMNTSAHQPD
ncbi:unnamed protein product [Lymnaea stagnalis]|uniref:Alpha-type protein kinase domain-containing protein n=1 Tax=Lymnaea stagnalis TaxID=6523 RepID=A0AAV2IEV5_LYMST